MEYERYVALKKNNEVYFADIIKSRFKSYIEDNFELEFCADYMSHRLFDDLLKNDGLKVFGMNVNMDGFQLLLDFDGEYLNADNFPFSRMAVDFSNDGNYSVYLDVNSFDEEWTVYLEDDFNLYYKMTEDELQKALNDMKNAHLMLQLKRVS